MKTYELFEHTADMGLRVFGKSQAELFAHAGEAFADLVTDPFALERTERYSFYLTAENLEGLFLKWLRELLYIFDTRHLLFLEFKFEILTATELRGSALGGKFNPHKHEQKTEIKAVTYHQYSLKQGLQGWVAEVILDI